MYALMLGMWCRMDSCVSPLFIIFWVSLGIAALGIVFMPLLALDALVVRDALLFAGRLPDIVELIVELSVWRLVVSFVRQLSFVLGILLANSHATLHISNVC